MHVTPEEIWVAFGFLAFIGILIYLKVHIKMAAGLDKRSVEIKAKLEEAQALRDEAHRFALAGHRKARARARGDSVLDNVPGVGPVKRRQLMTRFGGLKGLRRASELDLAAVPGISHELAARIVERLGRER